LAAKAQRDFAVDMDKFLKFQARPAIACELAEKFLQYFNI